MEAWVGGQARPFTFACLLPGVLKRLWDRLADPRSLTLSLRLPNTADIWESMASSLPPLSSEEQLLGRGRPSPLHAVSVVIFDDFGFGDHHVPVIPCLSFLGLL